MSLYLTRMTYIYVRMYLAHDRPPDMIPMNITRKKGMPLHEHHTIYSPFHKECPIWGPAVGDQWW